MSDSPSNLADSTADRVRAVIVDVLGLEVTPGNGDELHEIADAFDTAALAQALEQEFGFVIPDNHVDRWGEVGEVVRYIQRRVARG